MYEMEGVLPGHAPPRVASCLAFRASQTARWCRVSAGSFGFPNSLTFPESPPGWYPFPSVRYFYCTGGMARKGLRENSGEFFYIHTMSTAGAWLSAVIHGYPPVYAQPLHRLPEVTRRIRLGRGWPAFRAPLAPDRPSVDEAGGRRRSRACTNGAARRLRTRGPGRAPDKDLTKCLTK